MFTKTILSVYGISLTIAEGTTNIYKRVVRLHVQLSERLIKLYVSYKTFSRAILKLVRRWAEMMIGQITCKS